MPSGRLDEKMDAQKLIEGLNAPEKSQRLENLRQLKALYDNGTLETPQATANVNNHIHTIYSFSPYSPAKAAYMAWINGLTTAGIMDHDSVSGAEEFVEAGKILKLAVTVGFECRADMSCTPFNGRRINNPDQNSCAYLAMHGIPHQCIGRAAEFLKPYREQRNLRNRKMVDNINGLIADSGIVLDFDRDVVPISMSQEGGSITERHILFALANKIIAHCGKGKPVVRFLKEVLQMPVSGKNEAFLSDDSNPFYAYDLLGALKSDMVEKFYINAAAECPDVRDFIALADEIGAISAYAYLGDVGNSVTGDKKAQKFEDDYLDQLIPALREMGFRAVTYMPTRNTLPQLERLMKLCEANGLFQISGEDINSPRQKFVCEALSRKEFQHLITSTWALIGHEQAATRCLEDGMFSAKTAQRYPSLPERVAAYATIGREG